VTGLSDAERDASDVMQALAGLAALLRRPGADLPGADPGPPDPLPDDERRLLLHMADDAGAAAARVLAYMRDQRGSGDGTWPPYPRDWACGASGSRRGDTCSA